MAVFDASVLQLVLAAGLLLIHQLALALAAPAPEKLYSIGYVKASSLLLPATHASRRVSSPRSWCRRR